MVEATITEDMITSMRERAGTVLRIDHSVNNEEATRLAVTRFVDGIGDPNPLWRDGALGQASAYCGAVAPPSWVMAVFSGLQFGWPGLGAFHCRSELVFRRPIYIGDQVFAECTYDGFDGPKPSSFADRMVIDHFTNRYRNQHDDDVATIAWSVINYERGTARRKAEKRSPAGAGAGGPQWTEQQLLAIEEDVLAESARGADPRWWDDVTVGDSLDVLTKGPIGLTDEVAFLAGGGAPIPRLAANGVALRSYRRHPAWAFRDPDTGSLEPIYAVHYNRRAANAMGVPLQYDVGFQRQCWQIHLLTHWIGDDGWVKEASAEYRKFVFHGDVVRLGGEVTARRIDDAGEAVVDVTTWALNQHGDDVMPGRAVLALPRRGNGRGPVARRRRTAVDTSVRQP